MVYLKVKENSTQARLMLEYLKTLNFVEVIEKEEIPNLTTIKAIKEADRGGLKRFKTVMDLMNDLKS